MIASKLFNFLIDVSKLIRDGDIDPVKFLISSRPGLPLLRSHDDWSLLHIAAVHNRVSLIECMILNNFDPYLSNDEEEGWNALHSAALNNSVDVIKYFCQQFPEMMDMKSKEGETPHGVAKYHNEQLSIKTFDNM